MTKKEILEAAMKAKFNVALREAQFVIDDIKEILPPMHVKNEARAKGYKQGLEDALEIALYVIREKG